eukprot:12723591-Alexandrium_andersonii.AAC.1
MYAIEPKTSPPGAALTLKSPGPPEKCLRRAHRPASSAASASAQKTAQAALLRSFGAMFEALLGPR